jgi:8-oxo-dGTP diphosphatase
MGEIQRPGVGIGILILKENQILLGKRTASHGAGTWAPPGGHLEFLESFQECALREVKEETGLIVKLIDKYPSVTNDFFQEDNKHYVTLHLRAQYLGGEPQVLEPEKLEEWKWFEWEKFPNRLMIPFYNLLKQDYNPFN